MGASLVTGPTIEPVTLAMAKAHLRIDASDLDASLATEIIAAREFVEGQTRRTLAPATWDFTWDWEWPKSGCYHRIDLPTSPLISVTSISYVDTNGATQTLAADQYQVVGSGDDSLPRIVPAYDVTWPDVRWQPEAVTVRARCGYEFGSPAVISIPQALRYAILLQLEILHDRDVQAKSALEDARDSLMSPYRVVRL